MLTRMKVRALKLVITATVLMAVAATWGGWPEWRDGEEHPDDRYVVATVTWQTAGEKPGFIRVRGNLGGAFKTDVYSPSPFVEQGVTTAGDVIEVHAEALDGPFLVLDCDIRVTGGLGGGETQKTIWAGLRAYCRRVVS